jgi:NADH:ubiquinone oxidoreductase subunit 3 (subunit A)
MTRLTLLFIVVPILVVILLMLNVFLAANRPDSEKVTAYECGFSPIYGQTRAPFSIQYYLVGILFLIFDLEILLLYPYRTTAYQVGSYGYIIAMVFFTVLTLGFVYEYGKGRLYFTDQRSAIVQPTIERVNNSPQIPE